ncbi:MAG: ATP-binding protein [Candidatus Eisenbacteria sp.]|nr:ATP-binding protein [Candidatus Eisenbacteria bacterium]
MRFETSKPVSGPEFCNRVRELARLEDAASALRHGTTRYIALLGLRKMGKTSLLSEYMRRVEAPNMACFAIDCWEKKSAPKVFFREYIAKTVDAFVRATRPEGIDLSLKASLVSQASLMSCLADLRALKLRSLQRASEILLEIQSDNMSDVVIEAAINAPEEIAQETETFCIAVIDDFQELQHLNAFKSVKENLGDIYAFFRACWQRHRRVNYVLSGSQTTAMREILTGERAPLFQHFDLMEVGPFSEEHALELLRSRSADEGKPIPDAIAARTIATIGTCPFYLQVVGSELCGLEEINDDGFKIALQRLLFEESGRLQLYFRDLVGRVVGRSSSIERTLVAIAQEPARLSDLARRLGTAPGSLKSWINRCQGLVASEDGIYRVTDPCLALWLRMKSDDRAVLPTIVLGNEAEQLVARRMATAGFELVFQSRASRGAFDLLAVLETTEVGVQVKKAGLPFYLSRDELHRMQHWAKRLGWVPVLALVEESEVRFYPVQSRRGSSRRCRFDRKTQQVENLLDLTGGP